MADSAIPVCAGCQILHLMLQWEETALRMAGLSKAALMSASGFMLQLTTVIDVPFTVTSFHTVFFDNMGNAVPLASNGSPILRTTKEEQFRHLSRNERFYTTNVDCTWSDGTTRTA